MFHAYVALSLHCADLNGKDPSTCACSRPLVFNIEGCFQCNTAPAGKRDVKVKALEAAEAARKQAEQREIEKQERKKAMEMAKREKMERAAQEKLRLQQAQVGHENQEPKKSAMETRAKKPVAAGTTKTALADSSNHHGANNPNVLLKVSTRSLDFNA